MKKKINWKVRLGNKTFWISAIPALILLLQAGASVVGYNLDLGDLGDKLLTFINALFIVLALMGIVADPTTQGLGDSEQALTYQQPKEGK